MGRLSAELRGRAEVFGDRMLDVVHALERKRVYSRVIDQMVGCGTSVGANSCEADQALSAKDFCKALGTVVKERAESQYWLRTSVRRRWIAGARLDSLHEEAEVLSKIFSTMITRTRRQGARKK